MACISVQKSVTSLAESIVGREFLKLTKDAQIDFLVSIQVFLLGEIETTTVSPQIFTKSITETNKLNDCSTDKCMMKEVVEELPRLEEKEEQKVDKVVRDEATITSTNYKATMGAVFQSMNDILDESLRISEAHELELEINEEQLALLQEIEKKNEILFRKCHRFYV